jgi:plasmid stabilization system protein ParE
MVKKIKWTHASVRDRVDIYRYWLDRNKSDLYSEKLELLFNETANLIAKFPHAGTETNVPNLRIKVVKQFMMVIFKS